MYPKRYRKKAISRRPRKYARRVYKKKSTTFANKVKAIIHRQAENKVYVDYGANQTIQTASATNPTYKNLLPLISQGTGHGTRIGNEVSVRSAIVKGYVNLLPYNAATNPFFAPMQAKIWICSNKKLNTNDLTATSVSTNFFELTGGVAGFQGNTLDMLLSPNKEYWTIHSTKTFELGLTTGINTSYQDNSKFTVPFYFNYGRHIKKLKYDDGSTTPINRNMFIIFQVVNADGSSSSVYPAEFHYTTRVEFEDL